MTGNHARPEVVRAGHARLRHEILDAERALYRAQVAGSVDGIRPMLGADRSSAGGCGVVIEVLLGDQAA